MTTMSEKQAFVKANKTLISSVKLTNAKITSATEDELDALVSEIKAHADFTEETAVETTTTSIPVLELEGVESSEEFGNLIRLPFAGWTSSRLKNGKQVGLNAKFTYGDAFIIVRDNKIKALNPKHGDVFALKADSIELTNSGQYIGRLNWGADTRITNMNNSIADYQAALEIQAAQYVARFGGTMEEARATLTAPEREQAVKQTSLPKIIFG